MQSSNAQFRNWPDQRPESGSFYASIAKKACGGLLLASIVAAGAYWKFVLSLRTVEDRRFSCSHPKINMLQFNPHAECFLPEYEGKEKCSRHVFDIIDSLLQGKQEYNFKHYHTLDFASIEYMGSSRALRIPTGWNKSVHDCSEEGNGDDVTLLYNSGRWKPVGHRTAGCTGPKDNHVEGFTRPFIVRAFESSQLKSSDGKWLKVLVVAAHFPHPSGWGAAKDALKSAIEPKMKKGVDKVVLMADTNFALAFAPYPDDFTPKPSADILGDIGVPNDHVQSTEAELSCCQSVWYHTGYDRIIANFGIKMSTEMGLDANAVSGWAARFMHLPIVGSLCLGHDVTPLPDAIQR